MNDLYDASRYHRYGSDPAQSRRLDLAAAEMKLNRAVARATAMRRPRTAFAPRDIAAAEAEVARLKIRVREMREALVDSGELPAGRIP